MLYSIEQTLNQDSVISAICSCLSIFICYYCYNSFDSIFDVARLADIERKVLAGQLSREEAIIAQQQVIEQRSALANNVKEETKQLLTRAKRLREKEEEILRLRAQEIQQVF